MKHTVKTGLKSTLTLNLKLVCSKKEKKIYCKLSWLKILAMGLQTEWEKLKVFA